MFNCCDLRPQSIKIYDPRREDLDSQLIPGPKGDSVYLHIAWADTLINDEPVGFTLTHDPTKLFISFFQTTDQDYVPTAEDFTGWTYIKGDQGDDRFLIILYADDASGTNMTTIPTNKTHIAVISMDEEPFDLNDIPPQLLVGKWRRFVGNPTYIYIAYASSINGDNFSLTPIATSTHVAFRYSTEPLNPSTQSIYNGLWKKYVGNTGDKGDPGDRYKTSTTSSLVTSTGGKSLVVAPNLAWTPGQPINITNLSAKLYGTVTTYSAVTGDMTVNIQFIEGSGTHTNWTVNLGSFLSSSLWIKSGNGIYYNTGNVAVGQQVDNNNITGEPGVHSMIIKGNLIMNSSPIYYHEDDGGAISQTKVSWLQRTQPNQYQVYAFNPSISSTTDIAFYGRMYNNTGDQFNSTIQTHNTRLILSRIGSGNEEKVELFNDHANENRVYGITMYNTGGQSSVNPFEYRYTTPSISNKVIQRIEFSKITSLVPHHINDDLFLQKIKPVSGVKVLTLDDTGLVGVDDLLTVPNYTLDEVTTNGNDTTNSIIVGGLQVNGGTQLNGLLSTTLGATIGGKFILQSTNQNDVTTDLLLGLKSSDGSVRRVSLGTGISLVNNQLTVSIPTYTLPIASTTVLGGIKVGNTLTISNDGILNYSLPQATTSVRGGINMTLSENYLPKFNSGTGVQPSGIRQVGAGGYIIDSFSHIDFYNGTVNRLATISLAGYNGINNIANTAITLVAGKGICTSRPGDDGGGGVNGVANWKLGTATSITSAALNTTMLIEIEINNQILELYGRIKP